MVRTGHYGANRGAKIGSFFYNTLTRDTKREENAKKHATLTIFSIPFCTNKHKSAKREGLGGPRKS